MHVRWSLTSIYSRGQMCAAVGAYPYCHCMALIVLIGVTVPIVSCTVKYYSVLKGDSDWEYIFCSDICICFGFIERRFR